MCKAKRFASAGGSQVEVRWFPVSACPTKLSSANSHHLGSCCGISSLPVTIKEFSCYRAGLSLVLPSLHTPETKSPVAPSPYVSLSAFRFKVS